MNQQILGTHLDRRIILSHIQSLSELEDGDFARSLSLIWLLNPDWEAKALRSAIGVLVSGGVLGITVAGERVDESFSILLDTLSRLAPGPHIMTGALREQDAGAVVEAFLSSTWPSEERFDEWQINSLIVFGNETAVDSVQTALKQFLR